MSAQDGKTSNMPQVFVIGPDDLVEMVHEGKNVRIVGSDFLASIADQIEVTPGGDGGISVKGPFRLFEQERGNYRITNFDSQQSYEVSAEIGKVSILDDNIQYEAPATPQKAGFAINGKPFIVDVVSTDIEKPGFIPVSYGDPNVVNKTILNFTEFNTSEPDATHASTVWQFSNSPDFISILDERTDQGAVVSTDLSVFKPGDVGYVRVKYVSSTGQESQWSDTTRVIIKVKNDINNVLLNALPVPQANLYDEGRRSFGLYLEKLATVLLPGTATYQLLGDSLIIGKYKISGANFSYGRGSFQASPSNKTIARISKPDNNTSPGKVTIFELDEATETFVQTLDIPDLVQVGDVRITDDNTIYVSSFDTKRPGKDINDVDIEITGQIQIFKKIDGQWVVSEVFAPETSELPTARYSSALMSNVYCFTCFDVDDEGRIYWAYTLTGSLVVSEKTENGWVSTGKNQLTMDVTRFKLDTQMHVTRDKRFVLVQSASLNDRICAIYDLNSTETGHRPVFVIQGNTDGARAYSVNESRDTVMIPFVSGTERKYHIVRRIGDNWVITKTHSIGNRPSSGHIMGTVALVLDGQGFVETMMGSSTSTSGQLRLYE